MDENSREDIMTVNELIEQLKSYPGDMVVLTLGYEGGSIVTGKQIGRAHV